MPTELVVQDQITLVEAGDAPTMVAADATGNTFRNPPGDEAHLWVQNGGGLPVTVTVATARPSNFGRFPDKVLTVPAATLQQLPLFSAVRFTDPGTTLCTVTYSSVSSVTVAAVRPGMYEKEA
jgi:hypothetical protein